MKKLFLLFGFAFLSQLNGMDNNYQEMDTSEENLPNSSEITFADADKIFELWTKYLLIPTEYLDDLVKHFGQNYEEIEKRLKELSAFKVRRCLLLLPLLSLRLKIEMQKKK